MLVQRHAPEGVAGRRFLRRAGGRRLHCRSWCAQAEGLDSRVVVGRSVGAALRSRASDDGHVAGSSLCAEDSDRWRAPPGCVGRRGCRLCLGCGPRCRTPEGIAMPATGRWPLRPPPGAAMGAAGPKDAAALLGAWPRQRCPGHGSPPKFALDGMQTTPWRFSAYFVQERNWN